MKLNDLKQIIRHVINEELEAEVSRQLPKLLFEMLKSKPEPVKTIQEISKNVSEPKQPVKKVYKKYVKDPVLNDILNQTTPSLPQTPYSDAGIPIPDFQKIGVSKDEFMGEMKSLLNEDVKPPEDQVQEQVEQSPLDVSRIFNKNFKAILDKSKKKSGNNFSGMLQNW